MPRYSSVLNTKGLSSPFELEFPWHDAVKEGGWIRLERDSPTNFLFFSYPINSSIHLTSPPPLATVLIANYLSIGSVPTLLKNKSSSVTALPRLAASVPQATVPLPSSSGSSSEL
uniref:Uncharacterized protein n=1 Tax=Kalanchoe fedtschenkoi TaxID=63787 RepID=A0A7N0TIQ4_KALFE